MTKYVALKKSNRQKYFCARRRRQNLKLPRNNSGILVPTNHSQWQHCHIFWWVNLGSARIFDIGQWIVESSATNLI